jgi:hypothetical protein
MWAAGFQVTGIDLSEAMLALATEKHPAAQSGGSYRHYWEKEVALTRPLALTDYSLLFSVRFDCLPRLLMGSNEVES